jgi:hypothetical protein
VILGGFLFVATIRLRGPCENSIWIYRSLLAFSPLTSLPVTQNR